MNKQIGILYFTLSPDQEALRKRWSPSSKANHHIASGLYSKTLATIKSSGVPYVISPKNNQERSFAYNLCQAIKCGYASGYTDLIIVGNDCPSLTKGDITEAYQRLNKQQHTIGCDKSGGVYLFTLSKATTDEDQIACLPWCSTTLGKSLQDYLSSIQHVHLLRERRDIDTYQQLLDSYINTRDSFLAKLYSIIHTRTVFTSSWTHILNSAVTRQPNRGPPSHTF